MDEKNWIKPTEIIKYDPELGEKCINDPNNDWSNKETDGIGGE